MSQKVISQSKHTIHINKEDPKDKLLKQGAWFQKVAAVAADKQALPDSGQVPSQIREASDASPSPSSSDLLESKWE